MALSLSGTRTWTREAPEPRYSWESFFPSQAPVCAGRPDKCGVCNRLAAAERKAVLEVHSYPWNGPCFRNVEVGSPWAELRYMCDYCTLQLRRNRTVGAVIVDRQGKVIGKVKSQDD